MGGNGEGNGPQWAAMVVTMGGESAEGGGNGRLWTASPGVKSEKGLDENSKKGPYCPVDGRGQRGGIEVSSRQYATKEWSEQTFMS